MPKPIKAAVAAAVLANAPAATNAAKPARKLTATPPSAVLAVNGKLAARAVKLGNVPAAVAKPAKPAKHASKPAAVAKPAAPAVLTAATNNGRKPALVRALIAGASANDAKKLRGKLRKLFGGSGTWQQFDEPANHAKLAEMLKAPMPRAREIADAMRKPAAVAKPARKPRAVAADTNAAKPAAVAKPSRKPRAVAAA